MTMRRDSPIPLYQQLYNLLRKQIEMGEYHTHDVLPTEEQLAEMHGLSRVTVRKALQLLVDDHLIMRQAGKGTFVYPRKIEENLQTLQGFAEMMTTAYPTQVMESLSFETLQASGRLASLLELDHSERVLQIKRRHTVDDVPVAYAVIYLPYEIGRIVSPEEVETTPIYALLTSKAGITLKRATQRITAIAADEEKEKQGLAEAMQAISAYIAAVGPMVQAGFLPQQVAMGLLADYLRKFRFGRKLDDLLEEAKKQGAVLAYGSFITVIINFIIIAFIIFMLVRYVNKVKANMEEEEAAAEPAAPAADIVLLTEIRDALRKKK